MTYAIEGAYDYDEQDILFADREECVKWMTTWAQSRFPQPIRFRYSELKPDGNGVLKPVKWETFESKGAKVRKPTVEEAHQDELNRMAYYRKMDMHSTQPVSAPVWVAPTRYEGF